MSLDDMDLMEVPCACGAKECRVVYNRPYAGAIEPEEFNATTDRFGNYGTVVKCEACGLHYTNPRPSERFVAEGYTRSEDSQYMEESESRAINAHLCLATIKGFAKSGRLLEVGCANGTFLNAARTDFEVTGVELSRWAANEAARRFAVKVHAGTLKDAKFGAGHFDVIVLVDVIEHLTDPAGMLAECARILKPGGLLYLVTPDIDSLSAKVLRGSWWGLRPAHFFYFSRKTLESLLEGHGFETVECRSYGRIFTLDYWSSRLKNYPKLMRAFVERAISVLRIKNKFVYINTRDSLELVARKKEVAS